MADRLFVEETHCYSKLCEVRLRAIPKYCLKAELNHALTEHAKHNDALVSNGIAVDHL